MRACVRAKLQVLVDLRPQHGTASFFARHRNRGPFALDEYGQPLLPEEPPPEEYELGVVRGLPTGTREQPCEGVWPLLSLHHEGDAWAMTQTVTRRKDMEGDWIERAGFGGALKLLCRHTAYFCAPSA